MNELGHRSRNILFAAVTEYIASGDAVGSRTLARRYGLELSAASIRNVLSDLEEAGYLRQPHTSAGRVPTDRALRLFIDTLVEAQRVPPEVQARLSARCAEIYAASDNPLRETGRLLSELTGAAAVVAPRAEHRHLQQLRFLPTKPGQLLAVLLFSDGSVENRFVRLEGSLSDRELGRVHELLDGEVEGRSLAELREILAGRLEEDRSALDAIQARAFELGRRAVASRARPAEVFIEGQTRLMELPEYTDVGRFRNVLRALEERADLLALLDKTLAAGAVTVFVGSEAGELGSGELSLVMAPYTEHGKAAGAVGILGPTRMDYARVLPLVDATATAMSEALTRR